MKRSHLVIAAASEAPQEAIRGPRYRGLPWAPPAVAPGLLGPKRPSQRLGNRFLFCAAKQCSSRVCGCRPKVGAELKRNKQASCKMEQRSRYISCSFHAPIRFESEKIGILQEDQRR